MKNGSDLRVGIHVKKTIALVTLSTCMLEGCSGGHPVWSTSASSPDGHWQAVAHTLEYSGFGTGGAETIVEVQRSTGLKRSTRVLAFANDGPSIGLKMNWVSPTHLEVLFKGDPKVLYYQVVKTSGIEISVRNL
jgi:hypothetical protein